MKTAIFLAVRLDSSRLPRKALLPLAGKSMISFAMEALKSVQADVHAIVTDDASRAELEPAAALAGFMTFVGPKEDVLKRYALAAAHYGADLIVRATGDNPLVSVPMTERIIELHGKRNADLSHFIGLPLGTGVEVISRAALDASDRESVDPFEREHITQYLYRNSSRFAVVEEPAPDGFRFPDLKVTCDTAEDYAFLCSLFADLYRGKPVGIPEMAAWWGKKGGGPG
jgi:spore coat polysaccharide biosynthesis protein SpsF